MNKIMKNRKGLGRPAIFLTKNRRGWVEIVEAFVAVLLVAGVLLVVLNRGGSQQKTEISNRVYEAELSILREIQTNDTLRTGILDAAEPMPIDWSDARFPAELKEKIRVRTPNYLTCTGKICDMNQICATEETEVKDIYSQAITITSTLTTLGWRKLNLFCWTK